MLTFYKKSLVYLLRGLLYHPVLLNRDYEMTVGSDLFYDCNSDAAVGAASPIAPLLFQ